MTKLVTNLAQVKQNNIKTRLRLRVCVNCKRQAPRSELLRLTFDYKTGAVVLNAGTPQERSIFGRSAYLCRNNSCVEQALKGSRLRIALEGRKPKGKPSRRQIAWPLESQLIHTLRIKSTENLETCQNTQREEGD